MCVHCLPYLNVTIIRSVKVGTVSQKPEQILANLQLALPAIARNIQGGWDNIQAFHLKTNSSVSLPIWSCSLDEKEGGRWEGLTAVVQEEGESSEGENDGVVIEMEEDTAETRKEAMQSKGKLKRTQEDESQKPKKKAKGAEPDGKVVTARAATIGKALPQAPVATPSKPTKPASLAISKSKQRRSKLGSDPTRIRRAKSLLDSSHTTEPEP